MMDSLDKNYETQRFYNQNKATINKIKNQLSGNSGGGGCYIATMVYGHYDHPQVLELRKFRDDFLSKRRSGRRFIKFYYKHSPRLVEKLKHKQRINLIIQKGLNLFIKSIKKS
jgi:tRNA A37 N6-isopentenylltransferase MiaA